MPTPTLPTASDLRAEIARRPIPLYHLAPEAGINPARLGAMLAERLPMKADVATRLLFALARRGNSTQHERVTHNMTERDMRPV